MPKVLEFETPAALDRFARMVYVDHAIKISGGIQLLQGDENPVRVEISDDDLLVISSSSMAMGTEVDEMFQSMGDIEFTDVMFTNGWRRLAANTANLPYVVTLPTLAAKVEDNPAAWLIKLKRAWDSLVAQDSLSAAEIKEINDIIGPVLSLDSEGALQVPNNL